MSLFLRKIWGFVRPYRFRFFLGLFCGICYALINAMLVASIGPITDLLFSGSINVAERLRNAPTFLQPLVDRITAAVPSITAPGSRTAFLLIIGLIPLLMLLRVVANYLSVYMVSWSASRAIADIRIRLFDHLQNLSLEFFSRANTGDLISRITNDTQILYGIVSNSFASMVKDPVTVLGIVAFAFWRQPKLTAILLIVLPACLGPIVIYGRKVRKSARAMQGHISDLTRLMHESFTGNRIIKAYNLEAPALAQFRETTAKYVNHVMRVVRANEIPSQLTEFLGAVGIALVLVFIQLAPANERPSAGDFMTYLGGIVVLYPSIKALARLHNQLHQAAAASQRVFELLATRSTVTDPPQPVPLKAAGADIHFDQVDFSYGDKPVLRDIRLTVKSGQLVALVGSSGSGKTTVTNLLLRFYDPQRGSIRIGSTDIRQVAIRDLRSQIALVTQETILFHDTIRHNIALGRPGASEAEIEAAARAANAHEFIEQRPEGYDAVVGEKGINVSGGQRQRIAIARAILKNAPILVLDEATSALDTESERQVQAELEKLMQNRTTLCIAHRLSTIQKADLIVVLQEGRIVETGRHEELLDRNGVYRKLHELQFNA